MYHGKYEAGRKQPQRSSGAQPKNAPAPKMKKKKTLGTKIFYTFYFLMIIAACVGIWYGHGLLTDWLVDFESSQPDTKCQQIFDQYFADPNWEEIYELLSPEAVNNLSRAEFATYMENAVAGQELTYTKTSAGLSGGRKYILRLDGKNLGTFTLMNTVTGELEIPDWRLDAVEFFVSVKEYVTVVTDYGNTVTVNGTPLSDDQMIRKTETVAEEYLPEGFNGPRTVTYYVKNLLNVPQVTVTDRDGSAVNMIYDAESRTYTQPETSVSQEIPSDARNFVVDATKVYFRYMVAAATKTQLQEYFDKNSDTYKTIIKSDDRWLQSYKSYSYGEPTITDYCSYGDGLFSVRIAMDLLVTRKNNTVKTFSMDSTYFVQKTGKSWIVKEMTNVDVSKVLTHVRLTYLLDGQVLSTAMIDTEYSTLETPSVIAPEGKVFSGWFTQTEDEKGNTTYNLVFQPDENGTVKLPDGYMLEPMELHALFEEAK